MWPKREECDKEILPPIDTIIVYKPKVIGWYVVIPGVLNYIEEKLFNDKPIRKVSFWFCDALNIWPLISSHCDPYLCKLCHVNVTTNQKRLLADSYIMYKVIPHPPPGTKYPGCKWLSSCWLSPWLNNILEILG